MICEIFVTAYFEKQLKQLRKKYPNIKKDITPFISKLSKGESLGDPIEGLKNKVYKARIASIDQRKGKSGGFRVIYFFKTNIRIYLLTIYAKAMVSTISPAQIKLIIEKAQL